MNASSTTPPSVSDTSGGKPGSYVVVARRYRPQTFADLVGQEHIGQALAGAITSNRIGHAYLFTGARGVGKTSAARIFAKALNCEHGPTPEPCNQCSICEDITAGSDLDVIEIDAASNRGIEEIRVLRENVGKGAARDRFKVYIIDEVHMLTREAFNALLKTLEEPPRHVKFIFCTTEPEKIPITILSRCQRFDFAGIQTTSIVGRLQQIVASEGVEADTEALERIARRAAGSMRDSQSLLEQLLASGGNRLSVDDVNRLLGTADDQRLAGMVEHLTAGDAASAIADLDAIVNEGGDVGQLMDQLLAYYRDVMVASVGCRPEAFQTVLPSEQETVTRVAGQLGIETILACMQIIESTLARMRYSTRGRTLAELALVRICGLGNLDELTDVIAQLKSGGTIEPSPRVAGARPAVVGTPAKPAASVVTPPEPAKKKEAANDEPPPVALTSPAPANENVGSDTLLTGENASEIWQQALATQSDMAREMASTAARIAIPAPNQLVVSFPTTYTSCKSFCERPEQLSRFEQALATVVGQRVKLSFALLPADEKAGTPIAQSKQQPAESRPTKAKTDHPLVRRAAELFDARPLR